MNDAIGYLVMVAVVLVGFAIGYQANPDTIYPKTFEEAVKQCETNGGLDFVEAGLVIKDQRKQYYFANCKNLVEISGKVELQ